MMIRPFINEINRVKKDLDPKVILDVGSRDILQSIEFTKVYPNAKIYAFEPVPQMFNYCANESKKYPNITVFNNAISDEEGSLDFWLAGGNIGASSLLEPIDIPYGNGQWHKISVRALRLDNAFDQLGIDTADIVWMDTQGTELNALKSMGKYLKNTTAIHCEASPEPYYKGHILKDEVEKFLIDNNFTFKFYFAPQHPYGEGDIISFNKDKI